MAKASGGSSQTRCSTARAPSTTSRTRRPSPTRCIRNSRKIRSRLRERGRVRDIADAQIGALVEVRPVAGGEIVDDEHVVATRDERVDYVAAKEPRAAGDQDTQ